MTARSHTLIAQEEVGYVLNPARSYFALVMPEDSANLVLNPECADVYGYSAIAGGDTVTVQSTYQCRGANALSVIPAAANGGVKYSLPANLVIAQDYTFSVDVKGPGRIFIHFGNTGGGQLGPGLQCDAASFWQRFSVTVRMPDAVRTLCVRSPDGAQFFADGFQVEAKDHATTFISGNLEAPADTTAPGRLAYGWMGAPHRSASYRSRFVLDGGRPVPLSELGFEVTDFSGLGLMVPELVTSRYAMRSDGVFQSARLAGRQFTIGGYLQSDRLLGVLAKRGALIGAANAGRAEPSPVTLHVQLYDDELPISEVAQVECICIGGLEGVLTNLYQEKATVTFQAWRPFLRSVGNRAATLNVWGGVTAGAVAMAQPDGTVDVLPAGSYGGWDSESVPYRLAVGADGTPYVAKGDKLLRYSSGAWAVTYEHTNGRVKDACAGPDGWIYILAEDDDELASSGTLKRYSPASGAVVTLGPAVFEKGDAGPYLNLTRIRSDRVTRRIYVCGNFRKVKINGVYIAPDVTGQNWDFLCYYDIDDASWHSLPNLCDDDGEECTVWDVAFDAGGRVWVTGQFKLAGSVPESNNGWGLVASDQITGAWHAVGGSGALVSAAKAGNPTSAGTNRVRTVNNQGWSTLLEVFPGTVGDMEAGDTIYVPGYHDEYRLVTDVVNPTLFSVDRPFATQWEGAAYYLIKAVSIGVADLGGRVLCYDAGRDVMLLGGRFEWAARYDSWDSLHVQRLGHGIAYFNGLGGAFNVGAGLGTGGFGGETPFVEDLGMDETGDYAYVAGAFRDVLADAPPNSPFIADGAAVSSPGVAKVDLEALVSYSHNPWLAGPVDLPPLGHGAIGGGEYPAYGGAVAVVGGSRYWSNAYVPVDLEDEGSSLFDPLSGALLPVRGTVFVTYTDDHDSSVAETPWTIVTVPDAVRVLPRLEVRGPCTIERIRNATSGTSVEPYLDVAAGEVLAFSFAPGPIWIRSTTRGDVVYDRYGQDSFPDLGFVPGQNKILLDIVPGTGCAAVIYWTEEAASLDSLAVRYA